MSKAKGPDVKILKGHEAEQAVLEYVRKMNRPYGAVDVCANLKGAVPKAQTQKILLSLAEKGELVMKTYGKTTFFVVNQSNLSSKSAEELSALEKQLEETKKANIATATDIKNAITEVGRLKSTPENSRLSEMLLEISYQIEAALARLEPLRSGTAHVCADDIAKLDTDWSHWRAEWVSRKKIFNAFWTIVTDALPAQDVAELSESLGIEVDSLEHVKLESGALCSSSLKRKR